MEKMRRFAETKIAKVFLSLVFLSFMFWGIAGYIFGSPTKQTAFSVGGVEVSLGTLSEQVQRQKAQIQAIMKQSLDAPELDERMMVDQIIQNTTQQMLLDFATRDLGLIATDDFISNQVKAMPEFQNQGAFSAAAFHQVLTYNGLTERAFMDQIASQQTRYLLRSSLQSVEFLPSLFPKQFLMQQNQKRTIEFKEFSSMDGVQNPSDEDLLMVYEQNKYRFIQPEYRQIVALVIASDSVSGEKSKENVLKLAEEVENEVIGGGDWQEIAKQFHIDLIQTPFITADLKQKDGKTFSFSQAEVLKEAFAVDEKVETRLLKFGEGFILLRPEKVLEASPLAFENVKEHVRKIALSKNREKENYLKANTYLTEALAAKSVAGNTAVLTRTSSMHPDLIAKVFTSAEKDIFLVKAGETSYVVQLKSVENPSVDLQSEAFKKTSTWMKDQLSSLIYDDYVGFLAKKYGVKKNDEKISTYFAPKE